MEKRSIALRGVFFVLTAALVCICMLMNWFPVDLNLGAIQLDDVFGKVNALTLSGTVSEIEEMLGAFSSFLPEEFEALKVKSTILTVCAYVTIASYVCASVLHILKKKNYAELASLASAVLAIITAVAFSDLIKDIYTFTASTEVGNIAHDVVMKSPCLAVLIGGIASAFCVETIAEWVVELVTGLIASIAATVMRIVDTIVEFFKMIIGNIGYVLSDCAGAFLGILAGAVIMGMTDSALLGMLAGLVVAGLTAAVFLMIVSKLFYHDR